MIVKIYPKWGKNRFFSKVEIKKIWQNSLSQTPPSNKRPPKTQKFEINASLFYTPPIQREAFIRVNLKSIGSEDDRIPCFKETLPSNKRPLNILKIN